jgi:hypothetical protein
MNTKDRTVKRWITHVAIAGYLLALAVGFFSHAFAFGTDCYPVMYFVIWDMFCGWSGYEGHMEVIGEGESGKFYQLAPGPWGEFHPYGALDRHDYDPEFKNGELIGHNTLRHTVHEPMVRIFVVEEELPKKFNLPDPQYQAYYNKPKDVHKYCHVRFVLTPDGEILKEQPIWLRYTAQTQMLDNPRLLADAKHNHRPIGSSVRSASGGVMTPGTFSEIPPLAPLASPLAQ